jgi:phosphohistidine phosphatase
MDHSGGDESVTICPNLNMEPQSQVFMKTIFLMRHAKSSWDHHVEDDRDRPLSKRGKKNAEHIGKQLKEKNIVPDMILSSSAVRARQTAEVVMDEMKYHGDICYLNKLYMGEVETYAAEIKDLDESVNTLLLIGHSPCLDTLLQMLTGKVESLPTAAVARIEVPIEDWNDFNVEVQSNLAELWRPKDL